MKSIMLLAVLGFLTSCGKFATQKDLNKVKDRVESSEGRISALENKVNANIAAIQSLNNSIQDLYRQMEQAQGTGDEALYQINSLEATVETLQEQTTQLLANQAALELEDRVVGIYNPCPDVVSSDFTESFFQMSSGKLVAFFEDGNKRFLTVLKTGTTYQTTDSRRCVFTL